ncbi:MAG: DUF177 domain-containing protein [Candidatus Omnitrophota bacterium]
MKIRVRDIVNDGYMVEFVVKPADIGLENEEFLDTEKTFDVSANLQRADNVIMADVDVSYKREGVCARCLEHFTRPATAHYELDFEIFPGDEWIDLGARVREEMIMEISPRILCREDCRGICPGCGLDLNSEQCKCDIPFDGLKKTKRSK